MVTLGDFMSECEEENHFLVARAVRQSPGSHCYTRSSDSISWLGSGTRRPGRKWREGGQGEAADSPLLGSHATEMLRSVRQDLRCVGLDAGGVEEKLVEMTFQLYFKRLIKREK